jgi:tetratricopeptide (TPR) repeat protein
MDATPTDLHFQRGLLLYQQDRYALAEAELRQVLASDPGHAPAHAVLALCMCEQGRVDDAAFEAGHAIRLDPEYPFAHYALAQVRVKQGRPGEAEIAIREAIRLDPTFPGCYSLLGAVRLDRGDTVGAVEAAERGLAFDPSHAGCSAVRTIALLRLGRTDDATDETREALRRNPQDPLAHAGHGWALLHAKQPAEALAHFREALRIDPTSAWARDGLIEALKARYWVYRQMLGFFLWMGRRGAGAQWGVIVGFLVLQQVLASVARDNPDARPFVKPLLYAFVGFVMLTWLADPLFTLLLRLNRFGRLALNAEEKRQSSCVGAGIVAGAAGLIFWALPTPCAVIGRMWAEVCFVGLVPLAAVFRCPRGWPRRIMTCYVGGMIAAAVLMVVCAVTAFQQQQRAEVEKWVDNANELHLGLLYAGFGAGLLANVLIVSRRS